MSITYENLSQTVFPDEIDSKFIMQDISYENIQRIKEYESMINNGDISGAENFLANNTDLIPVCFNADKWNRHENMIIAIENFFKDNIQDYILNVAQNKGEYNSAKSYNKYNIVNVISEGVQQFFMAATRVPVGHSPVDEDSASYWIALTVKGEKGEPGTGLTYAQLWDENTTYTNSQCVSYNGCLWASLQNNNKGHDPSTSSAYWSKIFKVATEANSVSFSDNTTVQVWRSTVENIINNNSADIDNLKQNVLTVYISNNGNDNNDGLTPEAPMLNSIGITNKYKNVRQLTVKFIDGVYSDKYTFNSFPMITVTSSSGNADNVTLLSGLEINSSVANINNITVDNTLNNYSAIRLNKVTAEISNCKILAANEWNGLYCDTSMVDIKNCVFVGGLHAINAFDNSTVNIQGSSGNDVDVVYYASNGAVINYRSDNNINYTDKISDCNSGTITQDNILPISNGGTGANNAQTALDNLGAFPGVITLSSSIDLNEITSEGYYYITKENICTNIPTAGGGWLTVYSSKGSNQSYVVGQTFQALNGTTYQRIHAYANNEWTDWVSFLVDKDNTAVSRLKNSRYFSVTGAAYSNPTSFNGTNDVQIYITNLNPNYLSNSVPVEKGGTGAGNAKDARASLGIGLNTIYSGKIQPSTTPTTSGMFGGLYDYNIFKITIKNSNTVLCIRAIGTVEINNNNSRTIYFSGSTYINRAILYSTGTITFSNSSSITSTLSIFDTNDLSTDLSYNGYYISDIYGIV